CSVSSFGSFIISWFCCPLQEKSKGKNSSVKKVFIPTNLRINFQEIKTYNYLCENLFYSKMMSKIPVYFMPGLAASTSIFENIQLDKDRKSTRLNSSHVKISYAVF